MTLAEAADQFERTKREIDKLTPQKEAAVEVLKAHFRKSGRSRYKNLIGYSRSSRTVLDQGAVKVFLADKLPRFQKQVPTESLTLLQQ